MKRILVTAYAINPYKGSEDGTGWNYILQIAKFHKVVAITRENNKVHIERYMIANPNPLYANIQIYYFDTPCWMRFWKRGSILSMLYYQLWQRRVIRFILKNHLAFDIAHNLNFHNDWTPSFLWKLNKPFVWGPIGHHPLIPSQYLKNYGIKDYVMDRLIGCIKYFFWNYSRSLKKTILNADKIILMNSSVSNVLKISKEKQFRMSSIASECSKRIEKTEKTNFNIISVGRFVPLKGFDLAVDSFAQFINQYRDSQSIENCRLILVGKGPQEKMLKQLVLDRGIQDFVEFIPWVDRSNLFELYSTSSLFLFPSHEGAGMVVAEALSFGLPVFCLDNIGPGEYINSNCGYKAPIDSYENTTRNLAENMGKLFLDKVCLEKMSFNARQHFESNFLWDRRGEALQNLYQSIL